MGLVFAINYTRIIPGNQLYKAGRMQLLPARSATDIKIKFLDVYYILKNIKSHFGNYE